MKKVDNKKSAWAFILVAIGLLIAITLLFSSCTTIKYTHYLVVCEDYKNNNIYAVKIDSVQQAEIIFQSLMVESEGDCSFYIEHKKVKGDGKYK